jgi:hypothetical protein
VEHFNVPPVSHLAVHPAPLARVTIKLSPEWLTTGVASTEFSSVQRLDCDVRRSDSGVELEGVEVLLSRAWLHPWAWRHLKATLTNGFVFKEDGEFVVIRAERRAVRRSVAA